MGLDAPALTFPPLVGAAASDTLARAAANLQAGPGMDAERARQAAEDFEAVFISQMLAPMFEGLADDELFGSGPGADIYRSMLVEQYGKSLARAGGFGLADAVQREILKLQEAAQQ